MKQITVLLADDHRLLRQGVRLLLEQEPDIQVVGEAETGHQAVLLSKKLKPSIAVLDLMMPLLNGAEAAIQIRRESPQTKVIMLSAHDDPGYVKQAAKCGAAGFLLKHTSSEILGSAIRTVHKGGSCFPGPVTGEKKAAHPPGPTLNRLSPRELQVLRLIAEGKANKQVAAELGLSFKTVDKHRQNLMAKLNLHGIASLTLYAIKSGIIENKVEVTIT
jgi:DNA-binding NarL/FixJ family response regulator